MIRISPLRQCFIDDMEFAGLVPDTQDIYIRAVLTCVQRCGNIPPERITEEQLETYIRRRRREVARGTGCCAGGTNQTEFSGLKPPPTTSPTSCGDSLPITSHNSGM